MLASAGRSRRSFRALAAAAWQLDPISSRAPLVNIPRGSSTWHSPVSRSCTRSSPYTFPISQSETSTWTLGAVSLLQRAFSNMGTEGKKFKVLFCGVQFPTALEFTADLLKPHPNITVECCPAERLKEKIGGFDVIVPRMCRLNAELIEEAKKAKLIVQFGVGLEGVDFASATEAKIPVARISGASNNLNAISCAELCVYLILALLRQQTKMALCVQNMVLGEPAGETILGKTVLIVGYGAIGRELAPRLKPFGCKVLATRRRWTDGVGVNDDISDAVDERGGTEAFFPFVAKADIIVMCCMLTKETVGMVDAKFYETMKKGALLVNIARGGLLDYNATLSALESGKLGGLGIDVAWQEPFDPTDPIARHPNTIITPHVGGVTMKSYRRMAEIMSETILQVYRKEPLTLVEIANEIE